MLINSPHLNYNIFFACMFSIIILYFHKRKYENHQNKNGNRIRYFQFPLLKLFNLFFHVLMRKVHVSLQ